MLKGLSDYKKKKKNTCEFSLPGAHTHLRNIDDKYGEDWKINNVFNCRTNALQTEVIMLSWQSELANERARIAAVVVKHKMFSWYFIGVYIIVSETRYKNMY